MLQTKFTALVGRHTTDAHLPARLWSELVAVHDAEERHFHNLHHLEQMIDGLLPVKAKMNDWDTALFAVFYHDCVYDVVRTVAENDNEESSAAAAEEVLKKIGYPPGKIERCKHHILATKKHQPSDDSDTNYVTDTDLSVLGQPWEAYKDYMKNIRCEYAIYPDNIFYAGRLRVLRRFLSLPRLYKTDYFHERFEAMARENMKRELEIIAISK